MSLREPFVLALVFASISLSACAAPPLGAGEEADSAEEEDEEHEAEPQFIASGRTGVSCAERSVTGYDRGKAYGMKVITVSGKATAKATAHAFLKLQAAAEAAGVSLGINSGFRSMQEQQHLYQCYRTKSCNNGNLAARPGYSNHQNGRALDLSTSNWTWVRQNAPKHGFRATVPSERWHWEFSGADPGGPCSANAGATEDDTAPAPAGGDDDEAPAASGDGCSSETLGRDVTEGTCVQSRSNQVFYQCHDGQWFRGVANGKGPFGACTATHAL